MKKLLLILFVLPMLLQSQTNEFGIKFSGYVKTDFFYDTRQTVNIREGHFLLYPSAKMIDADGIDINAEPSLNFLSIQTRLTGNISAPDALGAKISGVIEADFFGNENANFVDANGFRLRHAFAKMTWDNTELLFGQFWHPLFVPSCFSDVISFNTGAPFQPFSRNPQIRITQKFGQLSLMGAVLAQRDFASPGGSLPLRNAAMPEVQGQLQFESKSDEGKFEILAGAGGGYKELRPLLSDTASGKRYIKEETVGGFSSMAFFKIKTPSIIYKLQGVYGQNLFDMTMMGGYGVSEVVDAAKEIVKYSPLNTVSLWTEYMHTVGKFQLALWAGYTEIMGSDDKIIKYSNAIDGKEVTLRGTAADNSSAIKNVIRISPRCVLMLGKLNIAVEVEYTDAAYALKDGTGKLMRDDFGKILETEKISNIRGLLSVILKF
jgi:hypothetical protein